jgi:transposase
MKESITIGIDLGDRKSMICELDAEGRQLSMQNVSTSSAGLRKYLKDKPSCLIALEAGTHSAWISRLLDELGHRVLVGNPRKLRVIWESDNKQDTRDAEMLARIARLDPSLLYPIHHRGERAQSHLAMIRARDALVRARRVLVGSARGLVKAQGARISKCSAECFHKRLLAEMPEVLQPALEPIAHSLETISVQIRHFDRQIEKLGQKHYPETHVLRAVNGVGALTSLAFILTIEESSRFAHSRQVGPFLGLTPKRDQSGTTDKPLSITKAGDNYLRRLLVQSAQYILGPFGQDCDLRRHGLKLAARGDKIAKRRAVVAVARKLAVLMHSVWKNNSQYDPDYQLRSGRRLAA